MDRRVSHSNTPLDDLFQKSIDNTFSPDHRIGGAPLKTVDHSNASALRSRRLRLVRQVHTPAFGFGYEH
jgi:hypothetical protein